MKDITIKEEKFISDIKHKFKAQDYIINYSFEPEVIFIEIESKTKDKYFNKYYDRGVINNITNMSVLIDLLFEELI
jgi:hypothetical protein